MIEGLLTYLRAELPGDEFILHPFPPSTSVTALPAFIDAVRGADWVILTGGTNFHDTYGLKSWRLLGQMAALFTVARASESKVAFSGIGIGPLRTAPGRALTRTLLSLSANTTVRDEASLRLGEALKPGRLVLGADLALLGGSPAHPVNRPASSRLGVSLVSYHAMYGLCKANDDRAVAVLAGVLRGLATEGLLDGVDIFPFSKAGVYSDLPISQMLADHLGATWTSKW
jgi:hypothetical protein